MPKTRPMSPCMANPRREMRLAPLTVPAYPEHPYPCFSKAASQAICGRAGSGIQSRRTNPGTKDSCGKLVRRNQTMTRLGTDMHTVSTSIMYPGVISLMSLSLQAFKKQGYNGSRQWQVSYTKATAEECPWPSGGKGAAPSTEGSE